MANPIGTITVRVNSGSPQTSKVTVGNAIQSMKSMTDLKIPAGANTGDIVIFNANTQSFSVQSASQGVPDIDAGFF